MDITVGDDVVTVVSARRTLVLPLEDRAFRLVVVALKAVAAARAAGADSVLWSAADPDGPSSAALSLTDEVDSPELTDRSVSQAITVSPDD